MDLDLDVILDDWRCPEDEVAARLIDGEDGVALVQLRVDLGLLQMYRDGRPDGRRYRGFATAADFVRHELGVGREISEHDCQELHRELQQFNYRRLALSSLAEDAIERGAADDAHELVRRALADIEHCLRALELMRRCDETFDETLAMLVPTLVFNRARLLVNLCVVEQRYDEAVEQVRVGLRQLEEALDRAGCDEQQREENAALSYLRQVGQRLREQYGIRRTLREQLEEAIEREDFETAARLRDRLRRQQPTDLPLGYLE